MGWEGRVSFDLRLARPYFHTERRLEGELDWELVIMPSGCLRYLIDVVHELLTEPIRV